MTPFGAADSIRTLVEFMTAWASAAQWQGMVVSTGVATVLQLLPLCNGILLMMMLGSMYGTAKGVAVASGQNLYFCTSDASMYGSPKAVAVASGVYYLLLFLLLHICSIRYVLGCLVPTLLI